MITQTAHAKLNLFLEITGKRHDGYHLIDSLFVFAELGDELTISNHDSVLLQIKGPFANVLTGFSITSNLAYRAAELLRTQYQISAGAKIVLQKNLPVSAGIGGGSADAAAVLRGLNTFWKLDLPLSELSALALKLGADVPACLYQSPLLVSGIGEKLQPTSLPSKKYYMVLVNPLLPLSTADVFQALMLKHNLIQHVTNTIPNQHNEFLDFLLTKTNDLVNPAIKQLPIIQTILSELSASTGCQLARMSGSGPTCFGIFLTEDEAIMAAQKTKLNHPAFWTEVTCLMK